MTHSEYLDTCESLQFQGHVVKWYVHKKGHFNKHKGFFSRSIAESLVREGDVLTPVIAD